MEEGFMKIGGEKVEIGSFRGLLEQLSSVNQHGFKMEIVVKINSKDKESS